MENKLKLLVFSPYYPPHVGGLENHAQQWNKEMSTQGHEVTVWTPHIPRSALTTEKEEKVLIMRYPALELIPNYPIPKFWHPTFWHQLMQIRQSVVSSQWSVVVVSRTRFFFPSLMATLFAKRHRLPRLHIEHGSDFVQLQNLFMRTLAKLYDYTFGRLVLKMADCVVANSNASAQFVQKLSGRPLGRASLAAGRKAQVIYRGIDHKAIEKIHAADLMTNYGIRITGPTIVYIGRLISNKGVSDLLRATKKLSTEPSLLVTRYSLLIIGDGPQRKSLDQQSRQLGIAHNTHFLGELPWEETVGILKASDIFINPSYSEGLPSAVIEAALCRTPIIATDVGGTPEIITDRHSSLLIPPRNIPAIASAIQELIANPQLSTTYSREAYRQATTKFTWKTAIAQYQALLDNNQHVRHNR